MRYVRAANIKNGELDLIDLYEMDFTEKEQQTYQLQKGDVLIVEGGATLGQYAMFVEHDEPICMQKTVLRVRAEPGSEVAANLLLHVVAASYEAGRFEAAAQGSGIKHLGIEGVAGLKVKLADDPAVQLHLAAQLDVVVSTMKEAQHHLAHLRTLRTALLNTALSPTPAATTAPAPALVPA